MGKRAMCTGLVSGVVVAMLLVAPSAMAQTTTTSYTYDVGDHVTSVTDPRGFVTSYAYDGLGQKWQQVSPDSGTTSYAYDAYGRLATLTRADGSQTTFGYDAIGRRTSKSAGGVTQTFVYDSCTNGAGRLCSVADPTGSVSYTYNPEGLITGRGFAIQGTNYAYGYGYNNLDQLQTVVYPDGNQAIYSYSNGVVSAVQVNVGGTVSNAATAISYRPGNGPMAGWTSANGLANTLTYDTDGRLTGIVVPGVQGLGLTYDTANRIVGISNSIDATMNQSFGYDSMSRLASVYAQADNEAFTYDANGNRTSQVLNGASATLTPGSGNNQIVSLAGSVNTSYGYDAKGNITTVSGAPTFGYDAFNRLSTAPNASYYVGGEGQRLRKTVGGTSTYFAPSEAGPLLAENPGAWTDYVWLNGRLIGRITGGQFQSIHDDQVGRPEAITDSSGIVVWRARNFAFDRTVTVANTTPLNLGFPGQYYDAESGLWNNGFRDYSPALGRYVESDPLGQAAGVNTYAYVGGNPLSNVDPLGLDFFGKCLAQSYLDQYGDDAWGHARQDRNKNQGPVYPGTPQEALRNAEHYLYAYQEARSGQWTSTAAVLSIGYAGYKIARNTAQGSSSPYSDDYPSMDEVKSGIEGSLDGKSGGGKPSDCGCKGQ